MTKRARGLVAHAAPALGLLACGPEAPRPEPPDVRAWVTPDVLASLDERGRFRLPLTPPGIDGPAITPSEAPSLATARAHAYASNNDLPRNFHGPRLSGYEREHGDVIDFRALRAGPRVYLTESPYEPAPGSWPEHVLEVLEPHYFVPLYTRRGYQALVAVVSPRLRASGTRVTMTAVPAGAEYDVPLSPECAVRLVSEATGRRVAAVPALVQSGRRYHPLWSRWRIVLDAPVSLRGDSTGRVDTTRVLYVASQMQRWVDPAVVEPVWYRARPKQPTADTLERPALTDRGRVDPRRGLQRYVARIRAGYPVAFERVERPRLERPGEHARLHRQDHFPCELRPRAAAWPWAGLGRQH